MRRNPHHDHHHGDHHGDEVDLEFLGDEWNPDDVELTTVGVDVGSSTSHVMFSRLHLRRLGKSLSSRYVVVQRDVLHRSDIHLTPYRPDDTIDPDVLGRWIAEAYVAAGLTPARVDTGAVILTGEAIRRHNARAIAELFASEAGRFVCATAGHHLEAVLSAHGSGAVEASRASGTTVLNVDIGGGTSKLALIRAGEIVGTASVNVGARLVAFDATGAVVRIEPAARTAAEAAGVALRLGEVLAPEARDHLAGVLAEALLETIAGRPGPLARRLLLTEPLAIPPALDRMTFSGGVAEYLYGREDRDFGDLARELADATRKGLGRAPDRAQEGIRATVVGASQFTVQVSGDTISLSRPDLLPLHNLPVVHAPIPDGDVNAEAVRAAVAAGYRRLDLAPEAQPAAIAIEWAGTPRYTNLRALAEGLREALRPALEASQPLALVFSADVSRSIGEILRTELAVRGDHLVAIDSVELRELDFIDIGALLPDRRVVPVVVKSLVFGTAGEGSELLAVGGAGQV
jgi:ethanolamine utilization protein EutA